MVLEIIERRDKTFAMKALQTAIKPVGTKLVAPKKEFPAGSPQLNPHGKAQNRCHVHEREVEGVFIYDMTPREGRLSDLDKPLDEDKPLLRVYYFAGGGWQMPPSPQHWRLCAELCHEIPNAAVSVVSYPLAPHSPAPIAMPQLSTLYYILLGQSAAAGEKVVFAGDSAGGNVAASLVLDVLTKDPDAPAPHTLLLISPAVDLQHQNPAHYESVSKHDPILSIPFINGTAKAWVNDWSPADPRVSPINADLSRLAMRGVHVYGITGTYDVLTPPALRFRDKLVEAGVQGAWINWERQMHCFPLAWIYGLKNSVEGKDWILEKLRADVERPVAAPPMRDGTIEEEPEET